MASCRTQESKKKASVEEACDVECGVENEAVRNVKSNSVSHAEHDLARHVECSLVHNMKLNVERSVGRNEGCNVGRLPDNGNVKSKLKEIVFIWTKQRRHAASFVLIVSKEHLPQ